MTDILSLIIIMIVIMIAYINTPRRDPREGYETTHNTHPLVPLYVPIIRGARLEAKPKPT